MKTMLVRIKPRDPHRGRVLRRFSYKGIRFEEGRGWYRVSVEVADHLRTIRQKAHDPSSLPAFDVCTEAEALRVDNEESKEAAPKRPAESARAATARGEKPVASSTEKKKRSRATTRKPKKTTGSTSRKTNTKNDAEESPAKPA